MSIACFFIYRFINLQFSDRIKLTPDKRLEVRRGFIKDKNGYILAISIESESLFANPEVIKNPIDVANRLSPIIGISKNFILRRIIKEKRFVWLKRKMDDEETERVKSLKIKGLHFKKEFKRLYPHDRLASNIIGFVAIDNNGLDGIEYRFDNLLSGRDRRSILQRVIDIRERDLVEGKSLSLTIDRFIQNVSEKEIARGVREFNAERGVIAILEVNTGRVLAIAKYPNFNPNYYYKYSDEVRGNFTVVNSFEPGSTFKIIALAAIMEHFPGALKKKFLCEGRVEIGDASIKCGRSHGKVNINDIIKHSCNVGIIKAMKEVSKKDFYNVIKKFGFGDRVGIELPGESRGIVRSTTSWSGLSKYSISIGQEISVNSLQLIAAFGAIGNYGVYLNPKIIESIGKNDGSVVQGFFPSSKGRILSENNAKKIIKIMREVVVGGTGEKADFEYYKAVGKTGTAQKSMRRGGYSPDRFVASFIGLAPMERPDICILVVIDEPMGTNSGGEVAAPVFARAAKRILLYRGVKVKRIAAKDPLKIKSKKKKFDGSTMPNFNGLTASESIKLLLKMQKGYSFKYYFIGSGKVYKQSPVPGTKISGKKEIILFLRER